MYHLMRNSSLPGQSWESNQLARVRVSCSPPFYKDVELLPHKQAVCAKTYNWRNLPFCPFEKFSYFSHKNVTLEAAVFHRK